MGIGVNNSEETQNSGDDLEHTKLNMHAFVTDFVTL